MYFPLREHLAVLPAFRNRTLRGAAVLLLLVGGMGGFFAWYGASETASWLTSRAVWQSGAAAEDAEIDGTTTTRKLLFHSLEGKVRYRTPEGDEREAEVDVTSVLEDFDTQRPFAARFDPAHPDRVAISWAQELSYGPWLWLATSWGMALFMLGVALWAAVAAFRSLRAVALAAVEPTAVPLRVHASGPQLNNGQPTGAHEVKYSLPGADQVHTAVIHCPPLLVEAGAQTLGLALRSANAAHAPVVLCEGLYPYAASEAQVEAVRAALAQHGPGELGA